MDELPFQAAFGVWGSWAGLILNILCLIAQFYVALFPIGGEPNANSFFQAYLAFPIVIAFYLFWKVFKRTRWVRSSEVDLVSGRREINLKAILEKEREERSHWGPMKKYFSHHLDWANSSGPITGCARCVMSFVKISGTRALDLRMRFSVLITWFQSREY